MSNAASGLAHLKPFLPGLGPLLEDAEVSEIMINGPGNVWIEGGPVNGSWQRQGWTNRPCCGRLFTSPVLWAWTRPPRPSSTHGLMMVPAWRSVFPRPVPTLRSPSGDSASGPSARRI